MWPFKKKEERREAKVPDERPTYHHHHHYRSSDELVPGPQGEDTPRIIYNLAQSQAILASIPSAAASLLPLAEHLICRLEAIEKDRAVRHDLATAVTALAFVSEHYLHASTAEITRSSFHAADRIASLRSRIASLSKTFTAFLHVAGGDPTDTEMRAAMAAEERTAEARLKELAGTARGIFMHLTRGDGARRPPEEKLGMAEQALQCLDAGLGEIRKDLAESFPYGSLGAARAMTAPAAKKWVVEACTELQVKVIDSIQGDGMPEELRQRRKQANKTVDRVLRTFEQQSSMITGLEEQLRALSMLDTQM
ncbi:hypothetical protein HDU96_004382 [Phlyctochytrium bullatum]|nr:hypothetical protein HDU96_004382 [Phlyctochytrium bullatum]